MKLVEFVLTGDVYGITKRAQEEYERKNLRPVFINPEHVAAILPQSAENTTVIVSGQYLHLKHSHDYVRRMLGFE